MEDHRLKTTNFLCELAANAEPSTVWTCTGVHTCVECGISLENADTHESLPRWYIHEDACNVYCKACATGEMIRINGKEWDEHHSCWFCGLAKKARESPNGWVPLEQMVLQFGNVNVGEGEEVWDENEKPWDAAAGAA